MEIYEVNHRIRSKYRKIPTRKNSVFGHFSRSSLGLQYIETFYQIHFKFKKIK